MFKSSIFIAFFISAALLAILHTVAIELYLYWTYRWFDLITHTLGGLTVALGFIWFFYKSGIVRLPAFFARMPFAIVLSTIVLAGLGWEFFEIFIGIPVDEKYFNDTLIDLVMDGLGAFLGYLYAYTTGVFNQGNSDS